MTGIEVLKKLEGLKKDYYSVKDLERILNMPVDSLRGQLTRWCKKGVMIRIAKGIYAPYGTEIDVLKIANQMYYPSYLSFESVLSKYGILSQVPYTLTFATPKRTRKMILNETEVEFTKLSDKYFFGYTFENGINIASPEKALVDCLYLVSKGKRVLNIDELYLKNVDKERLIELAKVFPENTRKLVRGVVKTT
jgi:predicted transcriptional regulator of viral defense system